ncbi:30S ribosomal protein S6 [Wolbachia pipientis]|uniref:Small ribosomal subunit protein bS6 n=1 Tax=Wolbachia pipientis TaxID=955 RepID=A0A1E7QJM9_WOLPI|nr:30S ribosomal protein S6 [Wolbachia pipientis]OEY86678.1 30S ribosomal protein S6 [Wolbachia pipientis]
MNLYEFTFIAHQGLLQQEVEGMIQELAVLLKNIKAEAIFQEAKAMIEKTSSHKLTQQDLEAHARKIQEVSINYSNILESITKILWNELEVDLSNLKGIKAKIDKELLIFGITRKHSLSGSEQRDKESLIRNTINFLRNKIAEHILQNLQNISQNQALLNKALEKFLTNIEASGLIKHEHWGLLDFAYPINKVKSGHYCMLCISSTPKILHEFERKVKLNEHIIRYLSVQVNSIFEGTSHMMNKKIEEQS